MKKRKKLYNLSDISPNSATTFYLYEVYAIPKEIRDKYLNKLLKRKNAVKQKNVRLIKTIYRLVEKEDFNTWNPVDICKKTGIISINQLYWHRSKILKDLRNMFFKWKEKEKEIEENKKYKSCKQNNNEVGMMMMKVRKMEEIGMRKEAKHLLYRIVNKHERYLKRNSPLILSEVYEFLLDYYSAQGNLEMFNAFHRKLKSLFKYYQNHLTTLKSKKIALISLRYLLAEAGKNIFHSHSIPHARKAKEVFEKSLSLARKYRFWDYQLLILARLKTVTEIIPEINQRDTLYGLITEGYTLAVKRGFKLQEYAFKSEIVLHDNAYTNDQKISLIKKIYENVLNLNPVSWWTLLCSNNYSDALLHSRSPNLIYTEILKLTVLHSFKSATNLYSFGEEFMKLNDRVQNISYYPICNQHYFKTQNSYIIINEPPNKNVLTKLGILLDKTIIKIRSTNQIELKAKLLISSLGVEFQKGLSFNFEKSTFIIRKIERIFKKLNLNKSPLVFLFLFLKTGLNMFEEARLYNAKKQVLDKYFKQFSDLSVELIQKNNYGINIGSTYLSISHIARELNYPELWKIVEEQWNYLVEHQPQVITSLQKQLKQQKDQETLAA